VPILLKVTNIGLHKIVITNICNLRLLHIWNFLPIVLVERFFTTILCEVFFLRMPVKKTKWNLQIFVKKTKWNLQIFVHFW
jgi:hypothetical protein